MATFGSFVTEREVYSDPVYTVYHARKSDDPGGEYAVKFFILPQRGLPADQSPPDSSLPDSRADRQRSIQVQETAAAVSRCIAPVLEKGSDSRGLWYATRFYPRSVNKMMSGKVALPRASLEHIIRCLAHGALDLKRACGRSHGDIRPPNIQVSKTEKLTEAEVVLCDPLPDGEDQGTRYESDDLHAIGLILLQLVRQRIISSEDAALMLPISPGPEWTRAFGSDASEWLALCNRLLDPNLSLDHFNLEALVARLDELKPKAASSRKIAVTAAIMLAFLGLAGFWLFRPPLESVEVSSDPPGATVLLDNVKQADPTPLTLRLKPGQHIIVARHDDLGLGEQATNVALAKTPMSIHLQFAYGSVSLHSDPPGATVWRGAVNIGQIPREGAPLTIARAPIGPANYQLKLEGFETATVTGSVSHGKTLNLIATLQPSAPKTTPPPVASTPVVTNPVPESPPASPPADGIVELHAEPPALIVDPQGKELGRASRDSALALTLAPGQYAFTARAEGLDDVSAGVTVKSGETNAYTFVLDCGTVDWTQGPAPATVSTDGRSQPVPASFTQKPGVPVTYVITAPGFRSVTNIVTLQKGERKSMATKLVALPLSVALASDPPGAEFLTENGTVLQPGAANKSLYFLEPGPVTIVARHPGLGAVTNHFNLTPETTGAPLAFKFDYGVLSLSNLPPDVVVYEGDAPLAIPPSQRWLYQKTGPHLYALRGRSGSQTAATNIANGLNFLRWASAEPSWKNSLGMLFNWVPRLPGGGSWPGQSEPGAWVAVTETTQGQYKKMDGTNPSGFREGDNFPVENVTCDQALNFCRWLSATDTADRAGWRYALPTDEQFAAFSADADRLPRVTNEGRAGAAADELSALQRGARIPAAVNLNAARPHPEPVGSTKRPNQYGLYDVVGNVWEWLARAPGREAFYAGGSYQNFSSKTVTAKAREHSAEKGPNIGFRVVLVPPP